VGAKEWLVRENLFFLTFSWQAPGFEICYRPFSFLPGPHPVYRCTSSVRRPSSSSNWQAVLHFWFFGPISFVFLEDLQEVCVTILVWERVSLFLLEAKCFWFLLTHTARCAECQCLTGMWLQGDSVGTRTSPRSPQLTNHPANGICVTRSMYVVLYSGVPWAYYPYCSLRFRVEVGNGRIVSIGVISTGYSHYG
jgi:hypothetical protein